MDTLALQQAVYDTDVLYTRENLDFDNLVDKSFLPAMIHIAQGNDITLVFVRMKNMRFPEYASETPALRAYIKSLSAYLLEQDNVKFIDLAHDQQFKSLYFIDLLHLTPEGEARFTQILADQLKAIME